ncbi:DUF3307 domain-containing protein [Polaribacter gangjinensis]|uniref:DUF3307 domain-containing protein n=1 Tax=Polaribacter gangjinensis TaxID=574710 RepID=A0A2S7WAS0_9FLAO|nr:DUF3307 domain-containing protein [Polaribacter gangjinensis]PQJ74361.1 hypothetical protein BTO13_03320 [Polaribacter gangjinensis]
MEIFLKLFLVHILGDFVFQPTKWVKDKEKKKIKSIKLYIHILIHAALLIGTFMFDVKNYWKIFLLIITSHFLIDIVKLYFQKEKTKRNWFFIDQLFHLIFILIASSFFVDFSILKASLNFEKIILFIISILIITHVSSIVVKLLISKWNPDESNSGKSSIENAGKYIGILERLFVFIFIITNHWEAIGFLLAAKSVFRFGDLTSGKDRKLTEYILIGTLLSFGIAILIGLLYLEILKIL